MKDDLSLESPHARRASIRRLGFDPEHLTFEEQRELLEIEARLPSVKERRRLVAVV